MGITTDGAAAMKKLGYLVQYERQLCLNHGIHLAVLDCLYSKKTIFKESSIIFNEQEDFSDEYDDKLNINDASDSFEIELIDNLDLLITKVRKIIKVFKYSPAKMEILENLKLDSGGEKMPGKIFLDVKTRWRSLEEMINIFCKTIDGYVSLYAVLKKQMSLFVKKYLN